MTTARHFTRAVIPHAVALAALCLIARLASADTINAVWNAATDIPVTANGYTANGNTVSFTLNFASATGTDLMVVNNAGLPFIVGTFDNLAQGQEVVLSCGGVTYRFVANYYGGTGNDLVLVWASNRVFAWGYNSYGQLGDTTLTNRLLPTPVISTGVLAGKTVVAVAAGSAHSLALCSDGTIAAWGYNRYGQLGDNTTNASLVPLAVNMSSASALFGKRAVAVAVGHSHNLALCSDGTIAAWGANDVGELGDNTTTHRFVPVAVNTGSGSALSGKTVVAIGAGGNHSLALCSDGVVAAWGDNHNGELGDNGLSGVGSLLPVAVNTNSGLSALYGKAVVGITAGYLHNLTLCSDGTAVAWGLNMYGALGDNGASGFQSGVPVAVNRGIGTSALYGKTVVAIAAGYEFSSALTTEGTVATWGYDAYGQLGNNTKTQQANAPVAVSTNSGVSALYGKAVAAITTGASHGVALCTDGTAVAWGYNSGGQVGDNSSVTNRLAPVAVNTSPLAAGQRFVRIASGCIASHTLALVAAPPASPITLTGPRVLSSGAFQLAFTNTPGAFFTVLAAANPALPLSNWTALDGLTEVTSGQFQFTDAQATNNPRRFYRVRSP